LVVAHCVGVALGLSGAGNAWASGSVDCPTQVNDTPSKLVPCIQTADLWNYMQAS
jgi:hypothetical protein